MNQNYEFIKNVINNHKIDVILIGCSQGGLSALETIFKDLAHDFPCPIIICQHLAPDAGLHLPQYFSKYSKLPTQEAHSNLGIKPGEIYFAPGGYHLLIETDKSFSLDVSEKVSYCRPSIDVLFESAIPVYNSHILAIILSGANEDGCMGAQKIYQAGGIVVVQQLASAKAKIMPKAVIDSQYYHLILSPQQIKQLLLQVANEYD